MSDRISTLEDALRIYCDDSHPLLGSDTSLLFGASDECPVDDKCTDDLTLAVRTLSITDERGSRYFGASSAEVSLSACLFSVVVIANQASVECLDYGASNV